MLILTASMGSGHDQVAALLAARLGARCDTRIIDLLEVLPAGVGPALRNGYAHMLRLAPWLYEGIFRTFFVPRERGQPSVSPLVALAASRLRVRLGDYRPAMVISTFHLAGQVAGRMRERGHLKAPSIVVITEPVAHALWVHPGTDLFVCPYPWVATDAARRTARPALAPGPVVDARFSQPGDPAPGRRVLALSPGEDAVLVSTGSWGVGDVVSTVRQLAGIQGIRPVVLCGRNDRLRRQLATVRCLPLGWRHDLPELLAAAAVLVVNAGGNMCAEAFAAGLPVVGYRPLPGHGRVGVRALAGAGLVTAAATGAELRTAVDELRRPGPGREEQLRRAAAVFVDDPAEALIRWAAANRTARTAAGSAAGPPVTTGSSRLASVRGSEVVQPGSPLAPARTTRRWPAASGRAGRYR